MAVIPCAPSVPVLGLVTFTPAEFVAAYPEFTGIANAPMIQNFGIAQLLLNNSCGSRVRDANNRQTLLFLLVAHLTLISNGSNDGAGNVQPPVGIVGRIASAAEGAVNVASEFDAPPNSSLAYFEQTKYGALYWAATARYRTFIYQPGPGSNGGYYGGPLGPWGGGCGC
jgi:uncharacterized protein DUF4054